MFKRLQITVAIIFTSIALLSSAEDLNKKTCELDGDQHELNMCAAERLFIADSEMNSLYINQLKYLNEPSKKRLTNAQRAWILYRDKSCLYSARLQEESGSIWPMELALCREALTKQRNIVLREYIECRENGCPY